MVEIRVHIDTLEYTREGLRTRNGIPLEVGQHNRVVLLRPDRSAAVAASYAGFPPSLSFPGPAVLSMLEHQHIARDGARRLSERLGGGARVQLFAHADAGGSEAENKLLSDRRAQCVLALLTRAVDQVLSIAAAEAWGTDLQQVMLRALECDPGPIDGTHGELTTVAVEAFQTRYGQGAYHLEGESMLKPELGVDGMLETDTREALIDAYVSRFSPRISPDAFVAKAPANGCAFHNPAVSPDGASNRRVSLVVHPGPLTHPQAVPCSDGDAVACAVVEGSAQHKCMWYREHVVETSIGDSLQYHFLPSWLKLMNGNYMLSVLTTVPDSEEVEFQVFASKEPHDGVDLPDPTLYLHDLGDVIANRPVHGVAQVVWVPPADFSPGEDGRTEGPSGRYVPSFRVWHPRTGARIHDSYPATDIVVLLAREELDGSLSGHEDVAFELSHDSGLVMKKAAAEASSYDSRYLAVRFSGIPEDGHYSLALHFADAVHRQVFENVPYRRLRADDDSGDGPASTCEHWVVPPISGALGSAEGEETAGEIDLLALV